MWPSAPRGGNYHLGIFLQRGLAELFQGLLVLHQFKLLFGNDLRWCLPFTPPQFLKHLWARGRREGQREESVGRFHESQLRGLDPQGPVSPEASGGEATLQGM